MDFPNLLTPEYDTTLPSGKNVKYRPFLVKEEKILMMLKETDEFSKVLTTMKKVVKSCLKDDISFKDMSYSGVTLSYRDYRTDFDIGLSGKATHMSSVGLQGPDDLELLNKPDRQLPVPVQESGIDFPDIVTPDRDWETKSVR